MPFRLDQAQLQGEDVFETASRGVVDYLVEHVPMQFWAVSRVTGGRQVYLTVNDNPLGLHAGDGPAWRESLCVR